MGVLNGTKLSRFSTGLTTVWCFCQVREEAKLEKEMEKAIKEEEKYRSLLAKANAEAEKAAGDKLDVLNQKIDA